MTIRDVCLIVTICCLALICVSYAIKLLNESFTKTKLMKLEAERSAASPVDALQHATPNDQAHGLTSDLRNLRKARFGRSMNLAAPDTWNTYTETKTTTLIPARHNKKKGQPQ